MTNIAVSDSESSHDGSVCSGTVTGTVVVGSNSFVNINGFRIMVEDGTMEIPSHNNPPCTPPNMQSHSYSPDTFGQNFVTIEGKKMVLLNDSYSGDNTWISSSGSNSFVGVI